MTGDYVPEIVEVTEDEAGRRVVRYKLFRDGSTFQHVDPDAVQHHYAPRGLNCDTPLFSGRFKFRSDKSPLDGAVRHMWLPNPRIYAEGASDATPQDIVDFLDSLNKAPDVDTLWDEQAQVDLLDPAPPPLPPQPLDIPKLVASHGKSVTATDIEQELGDGSALERVTFLVPNSCAVADGQNICDPGRLWLRWNGRSVAEGDGWLVSFDLLLEMDSPAPWRELRSSGGYRFTHVGELRRSDGATFSGEEAFDALTRIRRALCIALGRRTTCALPVGWVSNIPTWTRWRSAPVDAYSERSHMIDETIASAQLAELISCTLNYTSDAANHTALKNALSYYIAANVDVEIDLQVSLPVSGLLLLSYYKFVTTEGLYTGNGWKALGAEAQVRLVIAGLQLSTDIAEHFENLRAASAKIPAEPGEADRDAVGAVIWMRNKVMHPERGGREAIGIYEMAEAGLLARYWLAMALVQIVGYTGRLAAHLEPQPYWLGKVIESPWTSTP